MRDMGHGHGHGTGGLRAALLANVGLVALLVVTGIAAGSLALVAEAGHNLVDVTALALSLVAVRLARRAPTEHRPYGWLRGNVLAAQANAVVIIGVSCLVVGASVTRLVHPTPVRGGLVAVAAAIACLVNGAAAWVLRHDDDIAVRSALLHLIGDAASGGVVALSGVVVLLAGPGWERVDALASAAIALFVLWGGVTVLRQATGVLLEGTPRGVDPAAVVATIEGVAGVESAHDLHVWSLDGRQHALSVHVIVSGHPTLEAAQLVATAVKRAVSAPFGIAHATVELECEGCVDDGSWCAFGLDRHA
jgi:cobalt-zinc-cadmium efflux system protein